MMAAMPVPRSLGRSARLVVVPRTGSRGAPRGRPQFRQNRTAMSLRSPQTGQMIVGGNCIGRCAAASPRRPGSLIAGMVPQTGAAGRVKVWSSSRNQRRPGAPAGRFSAPALRSPRG